MRDQRATAAVDGRSRKVWRNCRMQSTANLMSKKRIMPGAPTAYAVGVSHDAFLAHTDSPLLCHPAQFLHTFYFFRQPQRLPAGRACYKSRLRPFPTSANPQPRGAFHNNHAYPQCGEHGRHTQRQLRPRLPQSASSGICDMLRIWSLLMILRPLIGTFELTEGLCRWRSPRSPPPIRRKRSRPPRECGGHLKNWRRVDHLHAVAFQLVLRDPDFASTTC